ncbi:MAG: hypothetical protein AVDCRST_MAG71-3028 [uncultured Lysobacter sp.]|uniref:DUF2894 domain-containing protein n=1 Tax=uncultured Lysobacter sp. TaxID=271060 RepID=A0A6J4MCG1_9GAMM|nr:MAG: hypothetical protein AVDCRST_MAG71-3028 [uncultured Lysobacter sp.]
MSDGVAGVHARLEAWRQQGADRMDIVRFARIDALARRAADEHGAIRCLLDARLAELVDRYASDLAARNDERPDRHVAPAAHAPSAIAILLDHLARQSSARDASATDTTGTETSAVDTLDAVRRLCTHARSDSQLRQALEQAPENAGPLNSTRLVHRALTLMRDVSPEYLQPLMAYIDTLAWLENMKLQGPPDVKGAPPTASGKRTRAKARSRRA